MSANVQPLRPLRTRSPIEWQGRRAPPRDWLIDGVVLRKTGCLFSGAGGLGKTLLAQQLMSSCAVGKPWLGFEVPQVRSFGIFTEDPSDEIWRRQEDINRHLGADMGDLEAMELMTLDELEDPALFALSKRHPQGGPTFLWDQIVAHVRDTGVQLVILDNAASVFTANENWKETVVPFCQMLTRLARDIDGSVMLIQHPGKDGETDGSYLSGNRAWRNKMRSQITLDYPKNTNDNEEPTDERTLGTRKNNYGKRGGPLRIEWREGVFVPVTIAQASGGRLTVIQQIDLRSAVLASLRRAIDRGQRFSLTPRANNHVATILRAEKEWHRYSWPEINGACEAMVEDGRLEIVEIGPKSKRYKLVRPSDSRYPGEDSSP